MRLGHVIRLRLVDTRDFAIIAEENSQQGIASTFKLWSENTDLSKSRENFYFDILAQSVKRLEEQTGRSLAGIDIIISGMASSTVGVMELPYKNLPFNTDGSNAGLHSFAAHENFPHPIHLISGVRSSDDVMRGEETQLIGCYSDSIKGDQLLIFPGTHSKHIRVVDGQMISFKTYMTGEVFELLSTKSLLQHSVEKSPESHIPSSGFINGVNDALSLNLLQAAFKVRTNNIFKVLSPVENYQYLSGLLIGTELKDLLEEKTDVTLCCSSNLKPQYQTALETMKINNGFFLPEATLDIAVAKGQYKIFKSLVHE